jgi:hypothetical protein
MGLFFIPQVMYEYGEPWWNDTDTGKTKEPKRRTCPTDPTWTEPGHQNSFTNHSYPSMLHNLSNCVIK